MVEIKTQKVLDKASADAKRYVTEYEKWWRYLCEVCSKTEDISVIRYHMFIGKGWDYRPVGWVEEDTFQELINLARLQNEMDNGTSVKIKCKEGDDKTHK